MPSLKFFVAFAASFFRIHDWDVLWREIVSPFWAFLASLSGSCCWEFAGYKINVYYYQCSENDNA